MRTGVLCLTSVLLLTRGLALSAEPCFSPIGRIVSIEGIVEVRHTRAHLEQRLCLGDLIQVKEHSRAAIVLMDDGVTRIGENTTLRLLKVPQDAPSSIELLLGRLYFFSRRTRELDVLTPSVTAGARGTEFLVEATANNTRVVVFEGRVVASNGQGEVSLDAGEASETRFGEPPATISVVNPRNAVQWAIYYPPLPEGAGLAPEVREAAQQAIAAVVEDRPADALAAGKRAVALAPRSPAAAIALSYAQQANLQLEAARDTLSRVDPNSAMVQARLAEAWLQLGDVTQATHSSERATALAPDVERVQTIHGFTFLARYRPRDAEHSFRRAIALDSTAPLPRFGLGLARIRRGDLAGGRNDLEIAVGLDPNRSMLRSYLGKAFMEEQRGNLAGEQFIIARDLDPRDPTPLFYDALRQQSENRPAAALRALNQSIALNDNRAVVRSQGQLAQDRATRGASVARIYNDLGFSPLGVREATRALALDPGNAGAHRFLADTLGSENRTEVARASELLQSQLLQDISINPVAPSMSETRLGIPAASFGRSGMDEFTSLFERNRTQLRTSGMAGTQDTTAAETVISTVHDNVSLSAGQFHYDSAGFRANNALRHDIYDVFGQVALSPTLNVQAEVRSRRTESGDLRMNFDPDVFSRTRDRDLDQDTLRVGGRYSPTPRTDVLASLIHSDRADKFSESGFDVREHRTGWQGETQWIQRWRNLTTQAGFASYAVDQRLAFKSDGSAHRNHGDIEHHGGYAYGYVRVPSDVMWTVGLGADAYSENGQSSNVLSPKLGVQWQATDAVQLRAVAARFVRPALVTDQTLQPTQIAGFNQFYDDALGSKSWLYGVGVDAKIAPSLFASAEVTHRRLEEVSFTEGDRLTEDVRENTAQANLFWNVTDEWALTGGVRYDVYEHEESMFNVPSKVATISLPFGVRYLDPIGFFAGAGVSLMHQDVQRDTPSTLPTGTSTFPLADASAGYRFRGGQIGISVRNILDHKFKYQDDTFWDGNSREEPSSNPLTPERAILGRIVIGF